jgi:uncharacterized delta-60 repeat protein
MLDTATPWDDRVLSSMSTPLGSTSAPSRAVSLFLSLLAAFAVGAPTALATPVRVDRSFGRAGVAAPDIGPSYGQGWFTSVSQQLDGRILATYEPAVNEGSPTLHRYLPDGEADPTFPPQPAPPTAPGTRVTLEDGSVLVASNGYNEGRLERINPDGTPDTTYGYQGRSEAVPFPISRIVTLPSGQVVVGGARTYQAGGHGQPTLEEAAVGRLDASGKLDHAFGGGGSVGLHASLGVDDRFLLTVVARPSGGVVVVVNSSFPDEPGAKATLVGLTDAGTLDPTYGSGGVVRQGSSALIVHPLAGGGLDVVGNLWGGKNECCGDFSLVRLTAAGEPDPNFGGATGRARADFGGNDKVQAARWEEDGSVLLAGSTTATTVNCDLFRACWETPALARFDPNGRPDGRFGSKGLVRLGRLKAGASSSAGNGVWIKILSPRIGGGFFAAGSSGPAAFIAALGADGAPDSSFADEGFLTKRKSVVSSAKTAGIVVDRHGRILVVGSTDAGYVGPLNTGAVIRYKRNGLLDSSYGAGAGYAYAGTGFGIGPSAIAVDGVDRALVLESSTLLRLTRVGRPDKSFGRWGATRLPSNLTLSTILTLRSGKILVAGRTDAAHAQAVVLRLLPSGKLDRTFRGAGTDVLGCGKGRSCAAVQMALGPNGRILLVGYMSPHGLAPVWARPSVALGRLLPNGRLDARFGQHGWTVSRLGHQSGAAAVAVQGRKILVAGWSGSGKRSKDLLLRYRADGHLDRTFASAGIARTAVSPFGPEPNLSEEMSLLPTKSRIIVVRTGKGLPVIAYQRDGRPDRSFGRKGGMAPSRAIDNFLPPSPLGALQRGNVVIAWNQNTPSGKGGLTTKVALQRLTTR